MLGLMLCYCGAADAYGSLRCHGKIINPGISMAQVFEMCGSPKARIVEQVPVRTGTISGFSRLTGIIIAEQWIYDRGWGRFPALLWLQDGRLKRIDYLPYRSLAHCTSKE